MKNTNINKDNIELTKAEIDADLKVVANAHTKSEKLSWNRKRKTIEGLVDKLKPFDDIINEQLALKQPIHDKINKKRRDIRKECIHPKDCLIHKGTYIDCKFCSTKIILNKPDE